MEMRTAVNVRFMNSAWNSFPVSFTLEHPLTQSKMKFPLLEFY